MHNFGQVIAENILLQFNFHYLEQFSSITFYFTSLKFSRHSIIFVNLTDSWLLNLVHMYIKLAKLMQFTVFKRFWKSWASSLIIHVACLWYFMLALTMWVFCANILHAMFSVLLFVVWFFHNLKTWMLSLSFLFIYSYLE